MLARSAIALCLVGSLTPAALGQSAEKMWATNCVGCHGDHAQGGGAGTRTLLRDDLWGQDVDRRLFESIKNGLPDKGMVGFGKMRSDEEIWALVVTLREFQARERRERLGSPKPKEGVYSTQRAAYKIETVIDTKAGLDTPWAVDFLPDGRMIVTERPGTLRVFADGKLGEPVSGVPHVRNMGQGGLLDVAVHPEFAKNGWIYLAYSDEQQRNGRSVGFTKIVRGHLDKNAWTDQQTIFEVKPEFYSTSEIHFGCKLAFQQQPDKSYLLYFGTGERGASEFAQDLKRPNGKVHRVTDDGKIPSDNPYAAVEANQKTVWSYGHRNPQGLVFDLEGRLFDTEHGPRGGDELNLVEKNHNYGWPTVCFGINYDDSPFVTPWPKEGSNITMPVDRWLPSIAACGLDVVRGDAFPEWKGDLLAGGLAGQCVHRVRLTPGDHPAVVEREEILYGLGRVRDVVCGPGGMIYIVLNDPHKVIRLVPGK